MTQIGFLLLAGIAVYVEVAITKSPSSFFLGYIVAAIGALMAGPNAYRGWFARFFVSMRINAWIAQSIMITCFAIGLTLKSGMHPPLDIQPSGILMGLLAGFILYAFPNVRKQRIS